MTNHQLKPLGLLTKNIPISQWNEAQKAEALYAIKEYLKHDGTPATEEGNFSKQKRCIRLTSGHQIAYVKGWCPPDESMIHDDTVQYGFQDELVYVATRTTDKDPTPYRRYLGLDNEMSILHMMDTETVTTILTQVAIHHAQNTKQRN